MTLVKKYAHFRFGHRMLGIGGGALNVHFDKREIVDEMHPGTREFHFQLEVHSVHMGYYIQRYSEEQLSAIKLYYRKVGLN